jgi:hypothetical protein
VRGSSPVFARIGDVFDVLPKVDREGYVSSKRRSAVESDEHLLKLESGRSNIKSIHSA